MIALTLTRDKVAAGVLVIHGTTHAPLVIGETPLSKLLLDTYVKGHRFFALDPLRKRRYWIIPPLNFEKFINLGSVYFKHASLVLAQRPCHVTDKIEIMGISYMLRNLNAD